MTNVETAVTTIITPAGSPNVAFTDKIDSVDVALRDRTQIKRDIKLAWSNVTKVYADFGLTPPGRRPTLSDAYNLVVNIRVFKPADPRLDDEALVTIARENGASLLSNVMANRPVANLIEANFPGFEKFADELISLQKLSTKPDELDKAKTEQAKEALRVAVDAYVAVLEAYDDTFTKVAAVKEYISVVKDVAEISAIADGRQKEMP